MDQSPAREERVRNVIEKYKWWSNLDIKEDLEIDKSGFIPIFLNFDSDFNISSAIRSSNAFNTNDVYIVGRRKVDTRGCVGAHHYMNIIKTPEIEPVVEDLRLSGYRIIAAEIDENAVSMVTYKWPEKSAVIFGQESCGISDEIMSMCDDIIYVPMRGSVRSMNVASTATTMMYDYSVKRGYLK